MITLNVLIACEHSGVVRDAFRNLDHNAFSCDLLPDESSSSKWSRYHFQEDARDVIMRGCKSVPWDLVIAHPPCTYLASSGLHWNKRRPERAAETEKAAQFFPDMVSACEQHAKKWAIENPIGCMSTRWRKPDQIIQPHQFGHDASKATCLWTSGLPALVGTRNIPPRLVNGKKRWANQTDSGQNRLPPSTDRWKLRSRTYPGIANAIAQQWTAKGIWND